MNTTEYSLIDNSGQTIAMGTQQQMFSMLKHHVPDGRYRIVGPDVKIHCLRKNGTVAPDPDGVCLEAKIERMTVEEFRRWMDEDYG